MKKTMAAVTALAILACSANAHAASAVVPPIITRGMSDTQVLTLTTLVASELDFLGKYDEVKQLEAAPSGYSGKCLSTDSCLGGIASGNGAKAVLASAATVKGSQLDVLLVFFEGGRIVRSQNFTVENTPAMVADTMSSFVREIITGESTQQAQTRDTVAFDGSNDIDDEDDLFGSDDDLFAGASSSSSRTYDDEDDPPTASSRRDDDDPPLLLTEDIVDLDDLPESRSSSSASRTTAATTTSSTTSSRTTSSSSASSSSSRTTAPKDPPPEEDDDAMPFQLASSSESVEVEIDAGGGTINLGLSDSGSSRSSSSSSSSRDRYDDEDDDRPSSSSSSSRTSSSSSSSSRARYDDDLEDEVDRARSGSSSRYADLDSGRDEDRARTSGDFRDARATLAGRVGAAQFQELGFVTFGLEVAVMTNDHVAVVAGIEPHSTKRSLPPALLEPGQPSTQWNTIVPVNFGVQYHLGQASVRPYVGGDVIIIPGYVAEVEGVELEGGTTAGGARVRGGLNFLLADGFALNLNVSAGMWSGKDFDAVQRDLEDSAAVPQLSGGTLIRF